MNGSEPASLILFGPILIKQAATTLVPDREEA
jgi:hypothetical protein